METKEFKVPIPDGMEIDKEKSTFECIKFKPIGHKMWRDDEKTLTYPLRKHKIYKK